MKAELKQKQREARFQRVQHQNNRVDNEVGNQVWKSEFASRPLSIDRRRNKANG